MKNKTNLTTLSFICLLTAISACTESTSLTGTQPPTTSNSTAPVTSATLTTGTASSVSATPIIDSLTQGTPEGDTDNIQADPDDLVEDASFTSTVRIQLNGSTATLINPLSSQGVTITQSNGAITVRSTREGVAYEVTGTAQGSLKIYSDSKFKLTLQDASITSSSGPAINIQSSKTAFVVLEGANQLSDSSNYSNLPESEDAKGAFFSEGQLVFSGSGSLEVAGNSNHGIASDDYIRVREGSITVTQAVKDAIHANDYIVVDGGHLTLSADSDGIEADKGFIVINDGIFDLTVADDGIVASYDISDETDPDPAITPYVTINGGTFNIKTTEGEGIESKSVLTLNGGNFNIQAFDDGINAIERLYINGGTYYVHSERNDAVDANGPVTLTGGQVIAVGSTGPEAGLDVDRNPIKITGGTFLGLGGGSSNAITDDSTQNTVIFSGVAADTLLHIQAEDGTEALTYRTSQAANTILYSSALLETGKTYNIYTGGSVSEGVESHGLYSTGTYSGDNLLVSSFTISDNLTQTGGSQMGGGGGFGGGPGGGFGGPGGRNWGAQNGIQSE